VKDLIAGRGHEPILLDFSMEEPPPFAGDIPTEEVARRGGMSIEQVRAAYRTDRDAATANQVAGAAAIVGELVQAQRVHGVIGIGGGTATLVATSVMRRLPFGMPKVMAPRWRRTRPTSTSTSAPATSRCTTRCWTS